MLASIALEKFLSVRQGTPAKHASIYNILLVSLPNFLRFSAYLKAHVVLYLMATCYLIGTMVPIEFKVQFLLKVQALKGGGCAAQEELNHWQFSAYDKP